MNTNNIIIAKDRKNKTLRFSGIEDWHDILKEFKECMSRNNHSGVLSSYDYDEPREPRKASDKKGNEDLFGVTETEITRITKMHDK